MPASSGPRPPVVAGLFLSDTEPVPPHAPGLSSTALEWFRCPVCQGQLLESATHLRCANCGRQYPVQDGLAVLIPARASVPPGDS